MFYGASEIDFRDGHVAGWKIDPKTSDTGETMARSAARARRAGIRGGLVEERCDCPAGNTNPFL